MSDFAEDLAGVGLLRLVSRGQALIAELLRLSDSLPTEFLSTENSKFSQVLLDFRYLKTPEHFEDVIEANQGLAALDDELRENQGPLLQSLLSLLEGCITFHKDLIQYLDKLQEGAFIQSSLESVLANEEGRQLLVEALSVHILLFLLLDHRFPGNCREKILIAVYRHRAGSELPNFDSLCLLCRSSHGPHSASASTSSTFSAISLAWNSATTREILHPFMLAPALPDEYLSRYPLPKPVIKLVLGRLRSEDLYSAAQHYPAPEQRTTALSAQAACVVLLLFLLPEMLQADPDMMQEIVQQYFRGCWIVPLSMGFAVDLQQAWDGYRAAKAALTSVVALPAVRSVAHQHALEATELLQELAGLLSEGILTADYVLRHMADLLRTIRNCNVALRWFLLHRCSSNRKVRDAVMAAAGPKDGDRDRVLQLLLDTARLEYAVSKIYRDVLDSKEARWQAGQQRAAAGMKELAHVFTGTQALTNKIKDANLERWFAQMADQVSSLSYKSSSDAGRKVQHMIAALTEVEQFHQIESSLATKQQLEDVRTSLQEMVRAVGAKESHLATLVAVSDAAYAWGLIHTYTVAIHGLIKADPRTVGRLHGLFLKLRSGLDLPLLRIVQAGSEDTLAISKYYSEKLIAYTRSVLAVIPATMLSILNEAMAVQTTKLGQLPTRVEKEQLRTYAQTEERLALARATHRIAVFTMGMMGMEKTLLGVIELDPRAVLEDGIRQQLRRRAMIAFQTTLGPTTGGPVTVEEVEKRLQTLANAMGALERAVEYFQDFVRLQGLQIWHEEMRDIIQHAVVQEFRAQYSQTMGKQGAEKVSLKSPSDRAAKGKVSTESAEEKTFLSRVHQWLLQLSNPTRAIFLAPISAWYDAMGQEQVGLRFIALLHASLGEAGLVGLDKLLGLTALQTLRRIAALLQSVAVGDFGEKLQQLRDDLGFPSSQPEDSPAIYARAVTQHVGRANASWTAVAESVAQLGQVQLLRRLVALQLRSGSTVAAGSLASTASTLDQCTLADMTTAHDGTNSTNDKQGEAASSAGEDKTGDSEADLEPIRGLLVPLERQLAHLGQHAPAAQVVLSLPAGATTPRHLALLLFLLTIWLLPKYVLDPHLAALVSRSRKGAIDCVCLAAGVAAVLRQFHPAHSTSYVQLLGQYIGQQVRGGATGAPGGGRKGAHDLHPEATNAVAWLHLLARHGDFPRPILESSVAPYLLSRGVAA